MKKIQKTICLIVAFVFCILTVSGCALFERDIEYYNNLVVARVGSDIKITKKQLINGYSSFGYQYLDNGMTQKQAMNQTLDDLIDREIMVELSIRNFSNLDSASIGELRKKSGMQGLYYQALNEYEKAEVRKNAFEGMNTSLKEIEKEVRSEKKVSDKITEGTEETAAESENNAFSKYQPYIIRSANNTVFKIDISKYAEKETYFIPDPNGTKDEDGNVIWTCTVGDEWTPKFRASTTLTGDITDVLASIQSLVEKDVARETYDRLVNLLKASEKGLRFSKNGDADVVNREIDRLIEGYAKNALYNRFNECFEQGISKPIDRSSAEFRKLVKEYGSEKEAYEKAIANEGFDTASLVSQAIGYYKDQVKAQINRYKKGFDTNESLNTKIMEGLADTYWLPDSIIDNYFTVSHILIGYSEEQKELITKKKGELASGGITETEYTKWLDGLEILGKEHDQEGKETGIIKNATQILNEIQDKLGTLSESNSQNRINIFRDYIYKYNTDPGMVNAEYEYVMGVNDSKMVEPFTNASRELYGYKRVEKKENGQPVLDENNKPVYEWEKKNGYTPIRSAISGLVITEHGAHIIMYTRPLRDFIQTSTAETDNNNYQNYLFKPLTSYGDIYEGQTATAKTYFDTIVEKLSTPAYENYEKSLIVTFKQERTDNNPKGKLVNAVKIYKGNYSDLV